MKQVDTENLLTWKPHSLNLLVKQENLIFIQVNVEKIYFFIKIKIDRVEK